MTPPPPNQPDWHGSLEERVKALCLTVGLSTDCVHLLHRFSTLVRTYGSRLNLVGKLDDQFIENQMVLGSLQLLRLRIPSGHLVDVGSGAGFPGIPLAITLPGLQVTLVEPRRKRAAFLRHAVSQLHLDLVQVVDQPIETWRSPACQWAVARAFRPLGDWLTLAPTLVVDQGFVGAYSTERDWSHVVLPPTLRIVGTTPDQTQTGRLVALLQKAPAG